MYDHAVTVLRLFKAGWFLDPQLAESTFVLGSLRARRVGPYRQAFLVPQEATAFAQPLLPYSLHIAELTTLQDGPGPIAKIWNLLEAYRSNGSDHASVDIALENFNRFFGLQLSGVQRVMYLFTALDAMLGGMSAREIGNVRLKASFQARVQAAFDAAGAALQPFDPGEVARWLDSAGRAQCHRAWSPGLDLSGGAGRTNAAPPHNPRAGPTVPGVLGPLCYRRRGHRATPAAAASVPAHGGLQQSA
jgi:hypothetical protein